MMRLNEIDSNEKRELAFQMVVAMRDTMNLAKKKGYKATYENAIRVFHDFSPELYEDITSALTQRNLSDDAKLYIATAQVKSKEFGYNVSALQLLEEDIQEYETLAESADGEQRKVLNNKLGSLRGTRKSLKPRELTENRILNRDTSKVDRQDFGAKFINQTDFYVDYELGEEKYLRLRLLHPDKPEHVTGADLVYEQHDVPTGKIRIIFLQYKIWEDGVLHLSQIKNLEQQLKKLQKCICDNGFCSSPENEDGHGEYRFPYCSAFLRPTDRMQQQNEKLVSSGMHMPICSVNRFIAGGGTKLERKKMRFQTLTHDIFEHLFNRGFIGSRWLDQLEVEEFYKRHKILESDESIIFYAREIKEAQERDDVIQVDL